MTTSSSRIDQFDGLRALAFLGVFAFHAVGIPYTWMGVDQFFVLSGYLITRNLLGLRRDARPRRAMAVFYYRRALRIIPPYYVALLAIFLLEPVPMSEAPWYFAFASNVRDTLYGPLKGQLLAMWSIAVEEQFYLLWPWLILLLPERRLRIAIVAAILIAPLARGILAPISSDAVYRLTISRTDFLGLGALIAWIDLHDVTWLARHRKHFLAGGGMAAGVFTALSLALPTFELEQHSTLYSTLGFSLEAATFACVLIIVRLANSGPLYRLLRFPPLEYLGRISYMAYLCHVLCLHLVKRLDLSGPFTVALGLAATVAFSSASWYLLEQPLQRLRGWVPLRSRATGSKNSGVESPRAGETPIES